MLFILLKNQTKTIHALFSKSHLETDKCLSGGSHHACQLPLLHTHMKYLFTVDPTDHTDIAVNLSRCLQLLEKFHV